MKSYRLKTLAAALGAATLAAAAAPDAAPPAPPWFAWSTVVNNNDLMPGTQRHFNSYNQPSVNVNGLVVIRARSKGGDQGQPIHGIYTRNMGAAGNPIERILDRTTLVPEPNNLEATFVETPSFPRIDMLSETIATRGNHQPVWEYLLDDGTETRAGTTGIYTNPFGPLITGASKLGAVPDFSFFQVPEAPGTPFDVFPGAATVTDGATIAFKGNYPVDDPASDDPEVTIGKTGVYYRDLVDAPITLLDGTSLEPAGGTNPVVLIANSVDTFIPGTTTVFGSTAPPSAANRQMVFAGFDDEWDPKFGGIYLAPLEGTLPELTTLVSIGQKVPGESGNKATFNGLGEGVAFDGRYVGFWGAWGAETRTVRLYCPMEGNRDRIAYCNQDLVCADTGETIGDENSVCNDTTDPNFGISCYQDKQVPVNQGIFVHDTAGGGTRAVAKTGARFDEFVFWNYSGKTPCVGEGHSEEGGEDDGEAARWRSSAFVAVSGINTAFKAVASGGAQGGCGSCHSGSVGSTPPTPDHARLVGIYLGQQPGQSIVTVLDTRTDGQALDPEAPAGSTVSELGIEREGLRGNWIAVSAKMGTEEDGMAGVYITTLPPRE